MSRIVFGTSALGNLYTALSLAEKQAIVSECFKHAEKPVLFDSAGKYGAGLALDALGTCLNDLAIAPEAVQISNKLGWLRVPLSGDEPTFEKGVWKDLEYDAVQKISYEGILECFEQGNALLKGYSAQLVSVHDPDEYLSRAGSKAEEAQLYEDILEAYRALFDLKKAGKVLAVGIGSKDWRVIERLSKVVELDWVMFANSFTIMHHPEPLLNLMQELHSRGVKIINSAVFHGGFLMGSDFYNYQPVSRSNPEQARLYQWRDELEQLCREFDIKPAAACVQFALSAPGIASIALNTSNAARVKENVALTAQTIPAAFWDKMKAAGLIQAAYPYV
ncbi:MAG: aldo/keto reductase [Sphingobacteriaceae bacterium]